MSDNNNDFEDMEKNNHFYDEQENENSNQETSNNNSNETDKPEETENTTGETIEGSAQEIKDETASEHDTCDDTQQQDRLSENEADNSSTAQCGTPETLDDNSQPKKETYYKETIKCKKKKHSSFKRFIAACVVISFCGGAGIGTGYSLASNAAGKKNTQNSSSVNQTNNTANTSSNTKSNNVLLASNDSTSAEDIIDAVYPSVVNITISESGTTTDFFGMNVPYESQGAGSGVIFNEDDKYIYIVTNNHVVESANAIKVSVTGTESIDATVVGTDSSNDLAVIKALKSDFTGANVKYAVAKFGDSDKLRVGQSVLAIGNALGEGKSATGGMVSVLNKSLNLDGKQLTVIQTSSPINPGNSGGALVNYNGEVIGINTAKTSTTVAEGMGYAIPSNKVKEIMQSLLTNGTSPKPYLGIMGSNITDELANLYKLPVGVLVREVFSGSPAESAGLKQGDIITSINGNSVMNMQSLVDYLGKTKVGDKAELNVVRDNKSVSVTISIGDANSESAKKSTQKSVSGNNQ